MKAVAAKFWLVLAMLLATTGAALADHMSGRYVGTGDAIGSIITIVQTGTAITGEFSGIDEGSSMTARQTGQDSMAGEVTLVGVGVVPFAATLVGNELQVVLTMPQGSESAVFTREAGAQPNRTLPPTTPTPPPTPQAETTAPPALTPPPLPVADYYYIQDGQQIGPVALDAVVAALAGGSIAGTAPVWRPGQADWKPANAYPELQAALPPPPLPADVMYYVAENGSQVGPLTRQEVLDRITAGSIDKDTLAWSKGMEAWAPLSTLDAFTNAFLEPPPLPSENEEPPPLPAADAPPSVPAATDVVTPPAEEPMSAEEEAELVIALKDLVAREFEQLPEENRQGIVACALDFFAMVSAADRRMLINSGFGLSGEEASAFQARYPDVLPGLRECGAAEDGM